jgi:hypothetical protein
LEDALKKVRHENEQHKITKKNMTEDLNKLLERRQEIDNLHNVLMGIINHSTSKKIDVEDLRIKLAESMRRDKHASTFGGSTLGASAAEISLKK